MMQREFTVLRNVEYLQMKLQEVNKLKEPMNSLWESFALDPAYKDIRALLDLSKNLADLLSCLP